MEMNATPFLEVEGLGFRYSPRDPFLFRNLSLQVGAGHVTSLLGPNGAGKSTFIALLTGLLSPTEGEIRLMGQPLPSLHRREIARQVACVPQQNHPVFHFTVREVLTMGRTPYLGILGIPQSDDLHLIEEIAARLELAPLLDRSYATLSGGELKRVLLARAFIQETPLLILDEPDAHLDLHHQHLFLHHVASWMKTPGRSSLLSTHHPDLAVRFSDRCLLLRGPERPFTIGETRTVITRESLEELFDVPLTTFQSADGLPSFGITLAESRREHHDS